MVRIPSLRRPETAPVQDENHDGRVDERDRTDASAADANRADANRVERDTAVGSDPARETRTYRSRATEGSADGGSSQTATMARDRTGQDRTERDRTERSRVTSDRPATDRPATDRDRTVEETATPRPAPAPAAPAAQPAKATGTARPVTDRSGPAGDTGVDREPEIAVVPGPKPRASLLATLGLITGVASALFVLTGTLVGYGIGLGVLASLLSIGGISATGRRHVAGKSDALIGLVLGLGAVVVGILALTGQFAWPSTDADTVQRFREWLDSQFVDRF